MALEAFPIREVEGQRVVDVDRCERPLRLLPRDGEQIGERARCCDRITRRDDDVVELNRHEAPRAMVFYGRSMLAGRGTVKTVPGMAPVICWVS